jgi:putative SOS response-associated peptidase YedK
MSGRYVLVSPQKNIEDHFQAGFTFPYHPRINAYPSVELPVIASLDPRSIVRFRWGLIPYWAKNDKISHYTFHARAENVFTKPSFKVPIRQRRCLVPANCFIEWRYEGTVAHPYVLFPTDQKLFAFAGIWDTWMNPSNRQISRTFSIITVSSKPPISYFNHRSPVILSKSNYGKWLDKRLEVPRIRSLLHPYDGRKINGWPANSALNNPANENIELLEPINKPLQPTDMSPGDWLGTTA